jgi:hypothetical protein
MAIRDGKVVFQTHDKSKFSAHEGSPELIWLNVQEFSKIEIPDTICSGEQLTTALKIIQYCSLGFSIVIDEDNKIIIGHDLLERYLEDKVNLIPVIRLPGLPEDKNS